MIDIRNKKRKYFILVFIIYFRFLLLRESFIRVKIIEIYFLLELRLSIYIYLFCWLIKKKKKDCLFIYTFMILDALDF